MIDLKGLATNRPLNRYLRVLAFVAKNATRLQQRRTQDARVFEIEFGGARS